LTYNENSSTPIPLIPIHSTNSQTSPDGFFFPVSWLRTKKIDGVRLRREQINKLHMLGDTEKNWLRILSNILRLGACPCVATGKTYFFYITKIAKNARQTHQNMFVATLPFIQFSTTVNKPSCTTNLQSVLVSKHLWKLKRYSCKWFPHGRDRKGVDYLTRAFDVHITPTLGQKQIHWSQCAYTEQQH
jgi:hypothetical protein